MSTKITPTSDVKLINAMQQLVLDREDEFIEADDALWFVLMDDDAPAGILGIAPYEHEDEAANLLLYGVAPKYQGKGYGARLARFAELAAYKEGYTSIVTYVLQNNPISTQCLVKCGYRFDEPEHKFADSESVFYFRKSLM